MKLDLAFKQLNCANALGWLFFFLFINEASEIVHTWLYVQRFLFPVFGFVSGLELNVMVFCGPRLGSDDVTSTVNGLFMINVPGSTMKTSGTPVLRVKIKRSQNNSVVPIRMKIEFLPSHGMGYLWMLSDNISRTRFFEKKPLFLFRGLFLFCHGVPYHVPVLFFYQNMTAPVRCTKGLGNCTFYADKRKPYENRVDCLTFSSRNSLLFLGMRWTNKLALFSE